MVTAELCGLGDVKAGSKAMDSVFVGIQEFSCGLLTIGGERREGAEHGGVPVVVGGEKGWPLRLGDVDDVGFMTVIG